MFVTCFSTVCSLMDRRSAIALVRAALRHQREHLELTLGQILERRLSLATLPDELRHDRRVEHRAALADPPHTRRELAEIGDAVLEQVADALGFLREQLDRVGWPARSRSPGPVLR